MRKLLLTITTFVTLSVSAQGPTTNMATYAGGTGKEEFNDVFQLSDGKFIIAGSADDLTWISNTVPVVNLSVPTPITNGSGTNKVAFLLEMNNTLSTILKVYRLPVNAAEDFHFIRSTNIPGQATGDIFVSGNTVDPTTGGYFLAKLNNNFVNGSPTGFTWVRNIFCAAGSYPKNFQPWDVDNKGRVIYAYGDSHGYNWAAIYRTKTNGTDGIVNNWRVHKTTANSEFYGAANNYTNNVSDPLTYSMIIFKRDGQRCELRSTNATDYNATYPDGNGGFKKGKWPTDILFNGPCAPGQSGNTSSGPGYNSYNPSATFTHGMQSICIDRRNNDMYIGFNMKSVLPGNIPDFEPAVMKMDSLGDMKWWTRLYHEMSPTTQATLNSTPDQYIDALAIDYSIPLSTTGGNLIIGARTHGNNVENFWEGNTIAATPSVTAFQNQFTGTSGNIHLCWLGRFQGNNGTILRSTYVAEYAEGATGLGSAHPDPNLDGWPNPNAGWPTLNTTYMGKNQLRVTADGSVLLYGTGRRTITTKNAFQKMVKPAFGGKSCWNDFVRMYTNDLSGVKYSSLLVGVWDTITQANGDNVRIAGVCKTTNGIVVVGKHTGTGANIPVANVPAWGNNTFNSESAVLAFFTATNMINPADGPSGTTAIAETSMNASNVYVYPNPATDEVSISSAFLLNKSEIEVYDVVGKLIYKTSSQNNSTVTINTSKLERGIYVVTIRNAQQTYSTKFVKE